MVSDRFASSLHLQRFFGPFFFGKKRNGHPQNMVQQRRLFPKLFFFCTRKMKLKNEIMIQNSRVCVAMKKSIPILPQRNYQMWHFATEQQLAWMRLLMRHPSRRVGSRLVAPTISAITYGGRELTGLGIGPRPQDKSLWPAAFEVGEALPERPPRATNPLKD